MTHWEFIYGLLQTTGRVEKDVWSIQFRMEIISTNTLSLVIIRGNKLCQREHDNGKKYCFSYNL
jgi:hypothetical protein